MRSKEKCRQPTSFLVVHDLVNQLSGIIGRCELLLAKAEPGTENAKQLALVCDLAHAAVSTVTAHRRQVYEELRGNAVGFQNQKKATFSSPRSRTPKAANLYICLCERFSDELTGFSCFTPTASVAPASLSKSSRMSLPSAKSIRAVSYSVSVIGPIALNCDLDHTSNYETEAASAVSLYAESVRQGTERRSGIGCFQ